jgi:orotidine-5'-phosphate decarboxylase
MYDRGPVMKDIPDSQRIIFALDVETSVKAKEWVQLLESEITLFKVGLELFLDGGFTIVQWIRDRGLEVMLDLKFFDVPQTVSRAVRQVARSGAALVTVHGNDAMLQAAVEAAGQTRILAVTALTSLDQSDLDDLGFACRPDELVLSRARRALDLGCAGVVSSGMEARSLRQELGDRLLIVTPGVRPVENRAVDDQKRTVSVYQAFANGADHVVVGRPIRQAEDPLALIRSMQLEASRGRAEARGT